MRIVLLALPLLVACSGADNDKRSADGAPNEEESRDAAPLPADAPRVGGADAPPPRDTSIDAVATDVATDVGIDTAVPADTADSRDTVATGVGPAGSICAPGASYGNPLPQNRTAMLVRSLAGGILEAPVWVAAQKALYFSDIRGTTNGRLQKYTPADKQLTVFVDKVGVGGLAVDSQGMLVASAHDKQRLSRFDPATGQRTDVQGGSMYLGKPFNQCNDVVVRSDGNMYFSDPTYQLAGREGQGVMAFYRLSPTGMVSRIATANNPNGVALSPDGQWLYLATTGGEPVKRFALASDGSVVGAGITFINSGSDGIAVDCAGNVYLSSGGQIKVFSPMGQALGNIGGLTAGFVTNSAFGGEDGQTLYITTSEALYQIRLNVPGFPS